MQWWSHRGEGLGETLLPWHSTKQEQDPYSLKSADIFPCKSQDLSASACRLTYRVSQGLVFFSWSLKVILSFIDCRHQFPAELQLQLQQIEASWKQNLCLSCLSQMSPKQSMEPKESQAVSCSVWEWSLLGSCPSQLPQPEGPQHSWCTVHPKVSKTLWDKWTFRQKGEEMSCNQRKCLARTHIPVFNA